MKWNELNGPFLLVDDENNKRHINDHVYCLHSFLHSLLSVVSLSLSLFFVFADRSLDSIHVHVTISLGGVKWNIFSTLGFFLLLQILFLKHVPKLNETFFIVILFSGHCYCCRWWWWFYICFFGPGGHFSLSLVLHEWF